jgi:hypothetical protein
LNLPASLAYVWTTDDPSSSVTGPFNQLWSLVENLSRSLLKRIDAKRDWSDRDFIRLVGNEERERKKARRKFKAAKSSFEGLRAAKRKK